MLSVDAISAQLTVIKAKEVVSVQTHSSGSRDPYLSRSLVTSSLLLRTHGGLEGPSGITLINNSLESPKIARSSNS